MEGHDDSSEDEHRLVCIGYVYSQAYQDLKCQG